MNQRIPSTSTAEFFNTIGAEETFAFRIGAAQRLLDPRANVETCRQRKGLANGRRGAHIRRMEKYRSHMLEVTVTNHPPKWEWEVSSGGEMVANGFEREQIAARFEGYNAMFRLLAAGWNP